MTHSLLDESHIKDAAPAGWRNHMRRFVVGRPLSECIDSGRDNILQLRLFAALLVVLGHSYVLVGDTTARFDLVHMLLPLTYSHLVGVMMFFTISGFLITLSFLRRPHLSRFLLARALRLWPALIVCVIVCAFVLGPLVTVLPLSSYFALEPGDAFSPYRYAWGGISLFEISPFLPGVFTSNPLPRYINGSLWTIPVEATMYLWVAGAGVLRLFRFPWLTSIAIALLFTVLVVAPLGGKSPGFEMVLKGFFGSGVMLCLLRRHVPISSGLMVALAIACLSASRSAYANPLMWLAVSYFVLWFAYVPRIPAIPRDLDLSYGTYLWAMPVQQTVVLLAGVRSPLGLFSISAPIVLVIASMSWLIVEKPALRLKDWARRRPVSEQTGNGNSPQPIPGRSSQPSIVEPKHPEARRPITDALVRQANGAE